MAKYYKREFLNLPSFHTVACILARLDNGSRWPELIISDCSRQVSLDVNIDGDEDTYNTLHKLDVLVKTLRDFRKAVYEAAGRTPPRL